MIRRPPRSTRTDTLFPYTTLFRSLSTDPPRVVAARLGVDEHLLAGLAVAHEHVGRRGAPLLERVLRLPLDLFPLRVVGEPPCEDGVRSEEHTSELQSLMRISYAVFCLKKKKNHTHHRLTK